MARHLGWYNNERGFEHVAAYLAQRDISKFDAKKPPKKTAAFWAIADASTAPEQSELADVLDKMGERFSRLDAITLTIVCGTAEGGFQEWLLDRKNRRAIPHRFERCGYVPVRSGTDDGLWVLNGRRQVIYVKDTLSLKASPKLLGIWWIAVSDNRPGK